MDQSKKSNCDTPFKDLSNNTYAGGQHSSNSSTVVDAKARRREMDRAGATSMTNEQKSELNEKRRESYQLNKDEINKKRRQAMKI
ncbi:hypothetical protein BS78_06G056900 [Paspalum vaginatum]|nr:hypothetical protein BS78_06G056900 [Paspalum vaginatum]